MKRTYLLILASLPWLAACHPDTRPEWQQAQAAPHLEIPAGVDTPGRSAEMVVPPASGDVEGAVHHDAAPPTSVLMTSDKDTDAAWQTVTEAIAGAGLGKVISRDDQQHRLGMMIKGSALPQPRRGFFSRLFRSKPDPNREYYARIGVDSENGETVVKLDGDGRAVLHLGDILESPTLHLATSKGGDVSRQERPRNRVPDNSGIPDASGRTR
mgnify:CR=1 FL=1